MREDERFEIERAFDALPHIVGASWATLWFRTNGVKNPTADEFRDRAALYLETLRPLYESFPDDEKFKDIARYIKWRSDTEVQRVKHGDNEEIEKRYRRYVDYG